MRVILTFFEGCIRVSATAVICVTAAVAFLALWLIERISDSIGGRDG
jgi:hypothetical protein